jgi:hypothetical protein
MNALPALSAIVIEAVHRQFRPRPAVSQRSRRVPHLRLALAVLLERAARAVAPTGQLPAH